MREPKQILMIIMNDETRYTYSVPDQKSYLDIYNHVVNVEGVDANEVRKILFFPQTLYDIEEFQYHYDEKTATLNDKQIAIDFKIDEFRRQRALLFKALDMEFMKTMENKDCVKCIEKLTLIKNHLRDMPDFLMDFLQLYSTEEITTFNAFNNVYDVVIINGGSGYTEPPTVTISEPDQKGKIGVPMKAEAIIAGEKVTEIKVTQPGSGYTAIPAISFSKSPSGNTAMAVCGSPENNLENIK